MRTPDRFFFNERAHDDGEKTVLGHKIPAGGGMKDGLRVLDILARHPATAKFIATKLTRYFVSDTPPPALVDRVAAAFTKSDGDIRETLRAIFFSPEFNSPEVLSRESEETIRIGDQLRYARSAQKPTAGRSCISGLRGWANHFTVFKHQTDIQTAPKVGLTPAACSSV